MTNVLVLSTTFIPSVLLCGHCQLDFLEKNNKVNYKFIPSHFLYKEDVEWADILVFIRSDTDIDAYVSKIAKKTNKHTVYVMDDDILNVPDYLSCYPYYSLKSTKNNILKIMSNCDTFLTPSPVLLEKYGKTFKNKFLISEPSLNRIIKKEENEKIKIGFAGSVDRTQDINKILEDAIRILVEKYKDKIDIEFFGAKPNIVDELNLKHIPYQDGYDMYTAYMAKCNWDIGLAPMPDTKFHRCKYFNKYVEYASFGIVGVYSNLEPYIYGIRDKENGILVDNTTEDWVNGISELIENNELRKKISNTCLKEANEKYALDVLAEDYLDKLLVDYKEPKVRAKIFSLKPIKFIFFMKRLYRINKQQGINFPSWLRKKIDKKLGDKKEERQHKKKKDKLKEILKTRKCVCIVSSMFDDGNNKYNNRVKLVDEGLGDCYRVYLNGEDRSLEYIKVNNFDDNHVELVFNSYDKVQVDQILWFIQMSGNCLIHSVMRLLREKISNEMFKLFYLNNVNIIWDTHGTIPEDYHEACNYHTEKITSEIEGVLYNRSNIIVVDDIKLINHFNNKYNGNKNTIVYPGESIEIK